LISNHQDLLYTLLLELELVLGLGLALMVLPLLSDFLPVSLSASSYVPLL
jgi:hypothetical protein